MCVIFMLAAKAYRESHISVSLEQVGMLPKSAKVSNQSEFVKVGLCILGGMRYDQMMTNIAKCVNVILKNTRALPITAFLDHIKSMHQVWLIKRKKITSSRETILFDHGESLLKLVDLRSRRYIVWPINHHELEIMDVYINPRVNLHDKTCMCDEFGYYEFIYSQALVTCRMRDINLYTLCSRAYYVTSWLLCYAEPIFMLCHVSE